MKLLYSFIISIIFYFLCYKGYAQKVIHYTTKDGLPHDVTYNLKQDSQGYVWIATDDGLAKFDGKDFVVFNQEDGLLSSFVTDIEEISKGKYAIATWGKGIHILEKDTIIKPNYFKDLNDKIYNIETYKEKVYSVKFKISIHDIKNKSFKLFDVKSHKKDKGFRYISSISKIDSTLFIHDNPVIEKNLNGLFKINSLGNFQSDFKHLNNYNIHHITKFKDKYIASSGNKLLFFDSKELNRIDNVSEIGSDTKIEKILITPDEKELILVASNLQRFKRIFSYNLKTKNVIDLIDKLSINRTISDAIFDFENNLWISTFGDGVYCYKYFDNKTKNILEGHNILDFEVFDDYIYAISPEYIFRIKNNNIEKYSTNGFAKKIVKHKNEPIFFGVNINDKKRANVSLIDGVFAQSTPFGVFRQSNYITLGDKKISPKYAPFIRSIIAKDSTLELFSNIGKIDFNVTNNSFNIDSDFNSRLPSKKINHAIKHNKNYVLATNKGLVVKNKKHLELINKNSGLVNENINHFVIKNDTTFIATQKGFSILKNKTITNYSKSFGINSLSINKIKLIDNKIWLAGDNGISIINPKYLTKEVSPRIKVYQEGNLINYKVFAFIDRDYVKLDYKINNSKWQSLTDLEGILNLENYKSGLYNVIFKTKKNNSNWTFSDKLKIKINTPWFTKWYNLVLISVVVIFVLILIFFKILKQTKKRNNVLETAINKRIKAEKELNTVRENIAKDFHDDLGNKLASISMLSEQLVKKVDGENSNIVNQINENSQQLYKGTKDFIFSLKSQSDYLEEVVLYLSDFCQEYCSHFNIEVEIEDNTTTNVKLPYYWSKQIVFIFKEAITNVAKHSKANKIYFRFYQKDKNLQIALEDNGCGFIIEDQNNNKTSGIFNMKKRAESIGGNLRVVSKKDKTIITFKGKLPFLGSEVK